jgi:hypothetical protein
MRGTRGVCAVLRKSAWRADLAALLALLLCFYSALAFAAPFGAPANPEICSEEPQGGAAAPIRHDATCLLCLPGCAATEAGPAAPAGAASLAVVERIEPSTARTPPTLPRYAANRQRDPPAAT